MRIAMLAPIAGQGAPLYGDLCENIPLLLAGALSSRGHDVTLFAAADCATGVHLHAVCRKQDAQANPGVWGCLLAAELFERADQFDIIHCHGGLLALGFSGLVSTPVVATIYGTPAAGDVPLYTKYSGKVFYISLSDADRVPGVDYLATIPCPDGPQHTAALAEQHETAYRKVLDSTKREDHRPWGYYQVLADDATFKSKRIVVYPGKRLSLQRHQRRDEHWFVLTGVAQVTLGDKNIRLTAGRSVDIPRTSLHRIQNIGPKKVVFIEIQTGDYFGEDDIERVEDDFGRM